MENVFIINCSKEKVTYQAKASDMYCSERFNLSKKIVESNNNEWYILSSRYGLLKPNTIIDPYDKHIDDLTKTEKNVYVAKVIKQFSDFNISNKKRIIFLCDSLYVNDIFKELERKKYKIISPFSHLNPVMWGQYLKQLDNSPRLKLINDLYEIFNSFKKQKGKILKLKELVKSEFVPTKGLYVFFNEDEQRILTPTQNRIVRVGTHAVSEGAKSKLYQRLKQHKGMNSLDGNHRSSIFRLHVGNALIQKNNLECNTWGQNIKINEKQKKQESIIEKMVSEYIGEMPVLLININDNSSKFSDRSYIEQNMIALLSDNFLPIDVQYENWLGNYSIHEAVRSSSLWNVDYTKNKNYDKNFLEILQIHIDITLGKIVDTGKSYAPKDWYSLSKNNYSNNLFSNENE
ncbi:MAG: DUF6884 domain-containing protein [Salinivirgaceae bacterium]